MLCATNFIWPTTIHKVTMVQDSCPTWYLTESTPSVQTLVVNTAQYPANDAASQYLERGSRTDAESCSSANWWMKSLYT